MPVLDALPPTAKHVHLMGIAGTAMGALAQMLHDAGYKVTGSDRAIYPPMSDVLARLGIQVKEGFVAGNLDPQPDAVVVGNVISAHFEEAAEMLRRDLGYLSMAGLVGSRFIEGTHSVVVAGTHGKTTTTAVTTWLLDSAGKNPGYLVGGVVKGLDRTARAGGGQFFVVEGDEYDTAFWDKGPKFLHYRPTTAIITSVEFDHADIYRDLDHVKESFRKLVALVPAGGLVIARADHATVRDVLEGAACDVWEYGEGRTWDGRVEDVDTTRGVMKFAVLRDGKALGTFESVLVGEHNLYNQVAAAAAATRAGLKPEQIARGFATFQGVKRRQEVIGEPGRVTVIDDFAHHPTAVRETLAALRLRFGPRRLWAIFEPRSATSRRAVFQEAYASAFGEADRVVIAEPFDQARIAEDERFHSDRLVAGLTARGVEAMLGADVEQIAATVAAQAHPHDVVAVLSNGGFGGLHQKLLRLLDLRFGA
jgi:UDP-N-acetylmuramate: L-alanyl-gamma-D-glutamyl-meso-diaminopimelate ligase